MNAKREAWQGVHGPIPKGWLVHALNGDEGDIRKENLAAIPRYPEHIGVIVAPYRARIQKLEKQLELQRKE